MTLKETLYKAIGRRTLLTKLHEVGRFYEKDGIRQPKKESTVERTLRDIVKDGNIETGRITSKGKFYWSIFPSNDVIIAYRYV